MSTTVPPAESLAELLHQLGDVPLARIRMRPAPGTATADDVLQFCTGDPKRLCELVDGVFVEKPMGHLEARLASWLGYLLAKHLTTNDIGIATGADGPHRLEPGQVRFPDVAFISYERIPDDAQNDHPLPDWVPNLAVEIISPGDTGAEMERKRREYFEAGVEFVWMVDPLNRSVQVFTSSDAFTLVTEDEVLNGGTVLPGFRLSVRDWFERATKLHPSP